jgi:hypothetical protein
MKWEDQAEDNTINKHSAYAEKRKGGELHGR